MNLSDSKYYSSLPHSVRENISRSGMHFHNDEELNSFVSATGYLRTDNYFFGNLYTQAYTPYMPFWPL